MNVNGYKKLLIWQKGVELVVQLYDCVSRFPKNEVYVMSDQMRRAAISIPSNIAEGYERQSTKEFIHFLQIARGSRAELETQLHICSRLNLGDKDKQTVIEGLCFEIGKMLNKMISSLKQREMNRLTSNL